jgi:hypothetical protein
MIEGVLKKYCTGMDLIFGRKSFKRDTNPRLSYA